MAANATPFIQKIFTSRNEFPETGNSLTYVGEYQRIWWDPVRNALYYSDGVTPGGILIGGGTTFINQIEGGAASSVYLAPDQIEGGSAATTYLPSQIINGGNAIVS